MRLFHQSEDENVCYEIYDGGDVGFYVLRHENQINTHDYLQDTLALAIECAFDEFGVPVDQWTVVEDEPK